MMRALTKARETARTAGCGGIPDPWLRAADAHAIGMESCHVGLPFSVSIVEDFERSSLRHQVFELFEVSPMRPFLMRLCHRSLRL